MRDALARHRIAVFLVTTYVVTWSAWIALALRGEHVAPGFQPLYVLGLLGPMAGALVTTALADGRTGLRDLAARMFRVRAGLRWWAVAIGAPFAAYAATYVVLAGYSILMLAPVPLPTRATLGMFNGFPVTNPAVLLVLLVVVGGLGEETGWRGFLLPALQRKHSPLVSSLLVAACWAPWHLPAFFIADTFRTMPAAIIPMWLLGLVSGSIFLAWLYNHGRCSIALVAAFHGTFNLLSGTAGVTGPIAAVESTLVMVAAAAIVIQHISSEHALRTTHLP